MGRPCISRAIKRRRLRAADSSTDVSVAGLLTPAALQEVNAPCEQKPLSVVAEPRTKKPAKPRKKAAKKAKRS